MAAGLPSSQPLPSQPLLGQAVLRTSRSETVRLTCLASLLARTNALAVNEPGTPSKSDARRLAARPLQAFE